jgi:hypothetical protein
METPTYGYAEVETAVAAALGVTAKNQRGALRGRLKHLQRLGLIKLKAEKGKRRVEYSYAQAAQWLVALILAETGIDPTLIVATLKQDWKRIAGSLDQATSVEARSGHPAYLCLWPRAMSAGWEGKSPIAINVVQPQSSLLPTRNELLQLIDGNPDNWLSIYNLTRALSRLENALPRRG